MIDEVILLTKFIIDTYSSCGSILLDINQINSFSIMQCFRGRASDLKTDLFPCYLTFNRLDEYFLRCQEAYKE